MNNNYYLRLEAILNDLNDKLSLIRHIAGYSFEAGSQIEEQPKKDDLYKYYKISEELAKNNLICLDYLTDIDSSTESLRLLLDDLKEIK